MNISATIRGMNPEVREAVKDAMQAKSLTQSELARRIGMTQPSLAKLLTGRVGQVPDSWQKVLDELGLELTVKPSSKNLRLSFLLQMAEAPNPSFFTSDENGRRTYDYGASPIADATNLVWYDQETWWVKLRRPHIKPEELGSIQQIGDNGVAKSYLVTEGPLKGFRVADAKNLISIWSPFVPGMN